jgi:hypothetical protein
LVATSALHLVLAEIMVHVPGLRQASVREAFDELEPQAPARMLEGRMISFRDEEPTYAEAAQAAAEHLEVLDGLGRCMACQLSEDDCNRYAIWCLGRTARATSNSPGWRQQFLDQLEMVISRHDCFPK